MTTPDNLVGFAHLKPVNYNAVGLAAHAFIHAQTEDSPTFINRIVDTIEDKQSFIYHDKLLEYKICWTLDFAGLSKCSDRGWRCGRGSSKAFHRNVDLPLTGPLNRAYPREDIAKLHFYLQIHKTSGVLMLDLHSVNKPVEYFMDGEWVQLKSPDKRVLYQKVNRLKIGRCEYELEYTITDDLVGEFHKRISTHLQSLTGHSNSYLRLLPGHTRCHRLFSVIVIDTAVTAGTFGVIYRAVDLKTGDPVAVKEMRVWNRHATVVATEIQIAREFEAHEGHLSILDSWCEHGQKLPCQSTRIEKVYMTMPLALGNFDKHRSTTRPSTRRFLKMVYQTLQGLAEMHRRGYMHRGIISRNLMIMSLDPPRAVVGDYGKAIKAQSSSDTGLGPIATCAPEVWLGKPYDNKIDSWSFAYAMVYCLGWETPTKGRITHAIHESMQLFLDDCWVKRPALHNLIRLVRKMLVWNPDERVSVQDGAGVVYWPDYSDKPGKVAHKRVKTAV